MAYLLVDAQQKYCFFVQFVLSPAIRLLNLIESQKWLDLLGLVKFNSNSKQTQLANFGPMVKSLLVTLSDGYSSEKLGLNDLFENACGHCCENISFSGTWK